MAAPRSRRMSAAPTGPRQPCRPVSSRRLLIVRLRPISRRRPCRCSPRPQCRKSSRRLPRQRRRAAFSDRRVRRRCSARTVRRLQWRLPPTIVSPIADCSPARSRNPRGRFTSRSRLHPFRRDNRSTDRGRASAFSEVPLHSLLKASSLRPLRRAAIPLRSRRGS